MPPAPSGGENPPLSVSMQPLTIRPRASEDDPAIVAMIRAINHDRIPITVAEYRHWLDNTPERAQQLVLVAERDGAIVGDVLVRRRIYSADGSHEIIVFVHREHLRQGIGSALCDRGLEGLRERAAGKTMTYVREDRPEAEE